MLTPNPPSVRFLSCEPLLGPTRLDLTDIHWGSRIQKLVEDAAPYWHGEAAYPDVRSLTDWMDRSPARRYGCACMSMTWARE